MSQAPAPGPPDRVDVEVAGRQLTLSNLGKPLYRSGFTKGEMIDYYVRVADVLVPHIAERPLTLRRFPEGVEGQSWFQTRCRGRPAWMETHGVRIRTGEVHEYCLVNDVPSLVWVVNLGTIELHPFLAPRTAEDRPTFIVFDLDPGPPAGLVECCRVALVVRGMLEEQGLSSFAKTSGSLGVHLYVPLGGTATFDETKEFSRSIADRLARDRPDDVVATIGKAERAGKVLVDWVQNDRTRSTVAPYSLRARGRPVVSTPVRWDEMEGAAEDAAAAHALLFGPDQVLERVEQHGDLFRDVLGR
ncbi:MAG TPA: non-homologous end-joining DNA ligase, partial [Actinomycetota bacterium]|nr:non-homologous end-joining DNA ligase [Actinomycetota bacterium]